MGGGSNSYNTIDWHKYSNYSHALKQAEFYVFAYTNITNIVAVPRWSPLEVMPNWS